MNDQQILDRIDELVSEEQELLHRHEGEEGLSEGEESRLGELKVQLDRAWDLLRQRRALEQYDLDPEDASPRDAKTVEDYEG